MPYDAIVTKQYCTVELLLEHLWSNENTFEAGVVRVSVNHSARSGGIIGLFFSIFYNVKVHCVFSLESPHRGDSNENAQYTIFNFKKENHRKLS